MRRWLSVALTLAAITLLEFHFFPGHTFLRSDSQIFVAMIERLAAPAFLSRDFVATPPHLVYTAYDEITLLLHRISHQDFQSVLAWQQLACRASAVLGRFFFLPPRPASKTLRPVDSRDCEPGSRAPRRCCFSHGTGAGAACDGI